MLIVWRKGFEVGDDRLDAEHRRMVDIVNALHLDIVSGAPVESLRQRLEVLRRECRRHFDHEEGLMAASRCPDLDTHRREHAGFLSQLDRILAATGDADTVSALPGLLLRLAHRWLSHIADADPRCLEWRRRPQGPSSVAAQ